MLEYTLPDGRTVESYPLTPAQQLMLYLSIQYGNHVPVLNICTGYYFQGEFDSKVMKEAILEAVDRCDGAVEIPQLGTNHSLNVSVSGGVVLWEFFCRIRSKA